MENKGENSKGKYPDHKKRHKNPIINLPFYKTNDSIFNFYNIDEDVFGPRKVATCKTCEINIEFIKGSNVFSSYTSTLKFHLQNHPEEFQTYLNHVAKDMKADTTTKFEHFMRMEHPRFLPRETRDKKFDEAMHNDKFARKNLAGVEYMSNDHSSSKNIKSSINSNVCDGENVRIIEYIHRFTNRNVPLRELVGTWDINARLDKKYKRYECLIENTGNIILDLERLLCKNTCFLDPENYDSCPYDHTGDISIFADRNFQQNIKNLDIELEKYPELMHDKSFDANLLKNVKCVQRDSRALLEMNRMLKIIISMITVKKETLKDKIDDIVKQNTNGKLTKPHFAIQLWGPKFVDFDNKGESETKDFTESLFYTYQHENDADCPAYTDHSKLKQREPSTDDHGRVIYPCNVGGCGKQCDCEICNMWGGDEITECPDHHPDHPEMFDPEKDIVIRRRIFFQKSKYIKFERPKQNTFWRPRNLKLAGMKKECDICKMVVKDHLQNHHSFKLHSEHCQICNHIELISENSMALTCYICMKKFQIKFRLEDHLKTHKQDNMISCDLCSKSFPTNYTKQRHTFEMHGGQQMEYVCEICHSKFSLERNLKRHITDFHSTESSEYPCTICDTKFARSDNLEQHYKEKHNIDKRKQIFKGINDESISYKCSLCDSVFTRNYVLRRHIATVHGNLDTTFACTMCGKSFGRKDNLQRHSETIHKQGDDNFSCKKCGKGFNRNENLIRHEELTCYKT